MTKTRDLADLGGGFIQAGTGAVQRTVESKLQDVVSVKDFGAVGDGVADDTVAIQAAVNSVSSGGQVYFPSGTYQISSAISLPSAAVVLKGASRWTTRLRQSTLNTSVVSISGMFCGIQSLSFSYSGGTPASGATAINVTGSYASLTNFVIANCHTGVRFNNCVAGKVSDFEVLDYESIGILIDTCNDVFVSNFILNAGNSTRGVLGGIRLVNKAEAVVVSNGDILLGQYSMTMDAGTYGIGTRPAYNNFTNVFFDSATLTAQITKCVETEFVGCWFSNGRTGGGSPGASISNCDSVRFTNCRFFNSGANGCTVSATAQNIIFTACKFESNSVTAGSGVAHGLQFADSTTKFQVIGCRAANGLYGGQQGYGIFVGGSCSDYNLIGNSVLGNVQSPGLIDAGSQPKTVYGNIGFKTVNSGTATISSGTTTSVVTHGLNVTPSIKDIMLTRTSSNAGSVDLYVNNITSTQFTINTAPAPSSNISVAWQARNRDA